MYKNFFYRYIKHACIAMCIIIAVSICARIYIVQCTVSYRFTSLESISHQTSYDTAIILGALVHDDGAMSTILKERAMAAVDLYRAGIIHTVLISGDYHDSGDIVYDEITPIRNYLLSEGVEESDILCDNEGYDTFHTMQNAMDIFDIHSAIVVTQDFHLARSVYIARSIGIDAIGYEAYKYPYPSIFEKWRNALREIPATMKAIYDVLIYTFL